MSYFAMCKNYNCIKSKDCYRYRMIPEKNQFYAVFDNICNEQNNFTYFITIRENDKIQKLKIKE